MAEARGEVSDLPRVEAYGGVGAVSKGVSNGVEEEGVVVAYFEEGVS